MLTRREFLKTLVTVGLIAAVPKPVLNIEPPKSEEPKVKKFKAGRGDTPILETPDGEQYLLESFTISLMQHPDLYDFGDGPLMPVGRWVEADFHCFPGLHHSIRAEKAEITYFAEWMRLDVGEYKVYCRL